jgi:outer membrane protein assembly factor BamA
MPDSGTAAAAQDDDRSGGHVEVRPDLPLRVRQLRLAGATRTKSHVFESELQDAYAADTVGGVVAGVTKAAVALQGLGIFDKVDVTLDKAEGGTLDEADVVITVKERR